MLTAPLSLSTPSCYTSLIAGWLLYCFQQCPGELIPVQMNTIKLWLLWSSSFWCQCLIFVLTPGGLLPAILFSFLPCTLASLSLGCIFIRFINQISSQLPSITPLLFLRAPLGLTFPLSVANEFCSFGKRLGAIWFMACLSPSTPWGKISEPGLCTWA